MRTDTKDIYQEARDTACCQVDMLTMRLTVEYVPDVRYYHCVAKTRGTSHPKRAASLSPRVAITLHTQFRTFTISRHASHSTEKPTQHEEEDFYQYYLNIDRPEKDISRILWPKQPVALSPDLALLQDPQSNADSVAYVLDSFVRSHQRHAKQPIAKALDQYREAKPGSLALRWLLRSGKLDELGRWEHSKLLKPIVHCLVAEGNIDILIEWILAKDAPTQSLGSILDPRGPDTWRGQLLSYTMQAQAYWTQETLLLEESIQTYLSTTRRAVGHVYIPHKLSAGWLLKLLSYQTRPMVKGESLDYFKRLMPCWCRNDPRNMELNQAKLALRHRRPDPLPALQLLQKVKDPDWHRWLALTFNPAGRGSSFTAWLLFIEVAQLLARIGRLDDAKWVLDLGRDILPLRFQMEPWKGGSTTSSNAINRRLPTPYEAAAGLVDSEGNYLSALRRASAYRNVAAVSTSRPESRAPDPPASDQ